VLRQTTALLALAVLALLPASAHALELGVQDDGRPSSQVLQDVSDLSGGWTRTVAYVGQPGVAQRIRDAHQAGQKIILTVGGTGTLTRKPTAQQVLAYIRSLPQADRYTAWNEPDLSGIKPCTYMRRWKTVRRSLGTRLLFGDFSPHAPLTYTAAARKCGKLPAKLGVALHPYYPTDPLAARCDWQGGICNLGRIQRAMRGMGVRAELWLDEFGYMAAIGDQRIAWLWPRAIRQATRHHAKVLIAYTAKGRTWNTRPGPLAWCSLTQGRSCPTPEHRTLASPSDPPAAVRHVDDADAMAQMLDYT
jgi:hypothetical protein